MAGSLIARRPYDFRQVTALRLAALRMVVMAGFTLAEAVRSSPFRPNGLAATRPSPVLASDRVARTRSAGRSTRPASTAAGLMEAGEPVRGTTGGPEVLLRRGRVS